MPIETFHANENTVKVETDLPTGFYMLKMVTNRGIRAVKKVIIY
jgi:hypothetical protein